MILHAVKRSPGAFLNIFVRGNFCFCKYLIQHCFVCRPSDSTVSEDAGIEPRTVATWALTTLGYRSHPQNAATSHLAVTKFFQFLVIKMDPDAILLHIHKQYKRCWYRPRDVQLRQFKIILYHRKESSHHGMEFLDIYLTKDSSLLLHAIRSPFYCGFKEKPYSSLV